LIPLVVAAEPFGAAAPLTVELGARTVAGNEEGAERRLLFSHE
jgi:hypothetical protein